MASTQKRVDVTSADTKQLGFDYQYLYFIVKLLQLRSGGEVGYEALDDIHTVSDSTGSTQYIQVKHTTDLTADGGPANLTTLSEDLWKTLSNWRKLISDSEEERDSTAAQKEFIQKSSFVLATNRNACQNDIFALIESIKQSKCTGANAKKKLLEIKQLTKSNAIQGYIDDVCQLNTSVISAFFAKIDFVSTEADLLKDIYRGIRDKMVPEEDVKDVFGRLYTQLKEDFFKTVKNKGHQVITYKEWVEKYQSAFNAVRTTLLPLRQYQPVLPDYLDQQPFAKELIEIEAIDTGDAGLSELAEFTEHFLSTKMQLLDWYQEGKIDQTTLDQFHANAFSLWKNLHKSCHRSTKTDVHLDRTNALSCFDEIMQKELRILSTDLGIPRSNGEFIYLANEEKIGWKYDWKRQWGQKWKDIL